MLANVIGTLKATCGAAMSMEGAHSAMNGQSLPQSGTEGLLGQQGMSSAKTDDTGSTAQCSLATACLHWHGHNRPRYRDQNKARDGETGENTSYDRSNVHTNSITREW
jgi:hypothetical protein